MHLDTPNLVQKSSTKLGGGFKDFLFSPLPGEDSHVDEHIFQSGWFNHQLLDFHIWGLDKPFSIYGCFQK